MAHTHADTADEDANTIQRTGRPNMNDQLTITRRDTLLGATTFIAATTLPAISVAQTQPTAATASGIPPEITTPNQVEGLYKQFVEEVK